jgi:hypothetical protein
VSTDAATKIKERLDSGEPLECRVENLAVQAVLGGRGATIVNLPLWAAFQCKKVGNRVLVVNRVISVTVGAHLNLRVSDAAKG